jgi:ubiquinol oxidase
MTAATKITPPTNDSLSLRTEQQKTFHSSRRCYGLLAKLLFSSMDLFYGKKRTLSKFKVLEIIARVPYQAWEHVAYIAMTHTYSTPHFARRIFEFVKESRSQQDNEQWHLLLLEEMVQKKGIKENFLMYRLLPQLVAFFYYHVSWILYVIRPSLSYSLNADFEDHAEHEYMLFVEENPSLEDVPFESDFQQDYGEFSCLADVFRQIGVDERHHKEESLQRIASARFS